MRKGILSTVSSICDPLGLITHGTSQKEDIARYLAV